MRVTIELNLPANDSREALRAAELVLQAIASVGLLRKDLTISSPREVEVRVEVE